MRVALLSHLASEAAPTGAERVLAELALGLRERGHEVCVGVPGPGATMEELARCGVPVAAVPVRQAWLTQPTPQPPLLDLLRLARWAGPGGGRRRAAAWLRRARPDVVHVNCLPNVLAAAAAAGLGLPVVWHVHEIVAPGWRRRFFARQLRRHATGVVAVSAAVGSWIEAAGNALQPVIVHNGVPAAPAVDAAEARRDLGLDPEALWIGYFSQLIPHKGADVLLAAVARVAARVPSLRLLVMAPGARDAAERATAQIRRHGLEERCCLLPPRPEAWQALAAVDLVAVPSIAPDPLPRIILEAMAVGRPVVASEVGGVPEMVEHLATGLLVPPGDVGGLAQAITDLARAPELRAGLGSRARVVARERFTQARFVEALETELERARRRGGRRPRTLR